MNECEMQSLLPYSAGMGGQITLLDLVPPHHFPNSHTITNLTRQYILILFQN